MIDVPMVVWDEVYEKWLEAQETGWDLNLWSPCSLCCYMRATYSYVACNICPLSKDKWCTGTAWSSRLNISYHYDDEAVWQVAIESFLRYIKPYCSGVYNE